MSRLTSFASELEREAATTRKMLERVPTDKMDWQPHPKSMTVRQLATHIAELPTWIDFTLNQDELDFSVNPYQPVPIANTGELVNYFEQSLENGRKVLAAGQEEELDRTWKLREGEAVYYEASKEETLRMTYCQIVHHRAQLGVYLRLLDIPIPGSYGPSADEA